MQIFSEVVLEWGNNKYTVPSDKVLPLIAVIEEHVTIEELTSGKYHRSKIAQAYTAALRFAGAFPTAPQVYAALFDVEDSERILRTVDGLLQIMIPPESLKKMMGPSAAGAPVGKKKKTGG